MNKFHKKGQFLVKCSIGPNDNEMFELRLLINPTTFPYSGMKGIVQKSHP